MLLIEHTRIAIGVLFKTRNPSDLYFDYNCVGHACWSCLFIYGHFMSHCVLYTSLSLALSLCLSLG